MHPAEESWARQVRSLQPVDVDVVGEVYGKRWRCLSQAEDMYGFRAQIERSKLAECARVAAHVSGYDKDSQELPGKKNPALRTALD